MKRTVLVIPLLLLVACSNTSTVTVAPSSAAGAVVSSSVTATSTVAPSPGAKVFGDATITSCASADGRHAGAKLRVTNSGAKPAAYSVTVNFSDGTGLLATTLVSVPTLDAGNSADESADSSTVSSSFTCALADVARFPSP